MEIDGHPKAYECSQCYKSYSREDLLVRHQHRCQSNRVHSKRKACNACIRAKAKCCCTQPTCSRCLKRGTVCKYFKTSAESGGRQAPEVSVESNTHDATFLAFNNMSTASPDTLEYVTGDIPLWNFQWGSPVSQWPANAADFSGQSSEAIRSIVGNSMDISSGTLPNSNTNGTFQPSDPPWQIEALTPSTTNAVLQSQEHIKDAAETSQAQPSRNLSVGRDSYHEIPRAMVSSNDSGQEPVFSKLLSIARNYPHLLACEDYQSPLMHREHYISIADITKMPKSCMAICCASGLSAKSDASFLRRAIISEKHRLVEEFHKHSCLDQWDALHAMSLYEIMELHEPQNDKEQWKSGSRIKGLHWPLLLKMTRHFWKSHPEAQDTSLLTPPLIDESSKGAIPSAWSTWTVSETARRTVFFINLANFLASHDPYTGEQSLYYEPLDDDMILHMPLPLSTATWNARTEKEWSEAMHQSELNGDVGRGESLKTLFSKYTKDHLQTTFSSQCGLGDSEELKRLVVSCALLQFT